MEEWDGSFLSSLSMWWSMAELEKPALLSAAGMGSGLAQPVELWVCVTAIQATRPHSHPRQALSHCFHFGDDFHEVGAGPEENLLSSCLQKRHSLRVQTTLSPSFCWLLPSSLAAPCVHHLEPIHVLPACRWHYPFLPCMQK